MKITCPNCNATGNIPEHEIPEAGRFLNCPRCKQGFTVAKPRPAADSYLVDTCPACNYSDFGDDRFETCPRCGVFVKTWVERQREEKTRIREQELLTKTHGNDQLLAPEVEALPAAAAFIDKLHPVNLIGWGCGLAAALIFAMGLMGLLDYDAVSIREQLSAKLNEQVSTWYVFSRFGLLPWLETLYGAATLIVAIFFLQKQAMAFKTLSLLLRMLMAFIPLYMIVSFIVWVMQPISHSLVGYLVEIVNIVFMTALFGLPIFALDRYLHDKRIASIFKQV